MWGYGSLPCKDQQCAPPGVVVHEVLYDERERDDAQPNPPHGHTESLESILVEVLLNDHDGRGAR